MENLEKKEETKIDNLDATLASPEAGKTEPESAPALDTVPVPTEEEKSEANISGSGEATSESDGSESPATSENVMVEPGKPAEPETPVSEPEVSEELGVTSTPARTFSQEELNEITGKTRVDTRNKTFQYIYDRYGVKDEAGLDELVGNAQRYDSLNEQYENDRKSWSEASAARDKELADIKEQVALMQSGIDNARYEDAKLILRGKGLEVTLDNINTELATHPEWSKKESVSEKPFEKVGPGVSNSTPNEPVTKLSVLGNEPTSGSGESEEDIAMRMFRV